MARDNDATMGIRGAPAKPGTAKRSPGIRRSRFLRQPAGNATLLRFNAEQGSATIDFGSEGPKVEVSSARIELLAAYMRARRAFDNDAELARALGIDRTRLSAWTQGSAAPRYEHQRLLSDLATTVEALRRAVHPSVMKDWLTSPKVQLNNLTPLAVLSEGRLADVLQTVNASEHDAHA